MLTLGELNRLNSDATAADAKASRASMVQDQLQKIRVGDAPLMVVYKNMGHWQDEAKSLIEGVINEFGADLLRIVEMRQEAFARRCKTEAATKRAQLATMVA